MIKRLTRLGNSDALIISKEMKAHLNLDDNRIEVQYHEGRIVLSRAKSFDEALESTFKQFDTALKNLAK